VVKAANPDAYLVGEIWNADPRWVGVGHFDGLMNYPIMDALTGLLATQSLDAVHYAEKVAGLLSLYPRENLFAMYTPLDSHDTERILTKMGNNLDKTKLAFLFQFAFPGAPAIYYGDEIGLVGGKDPGCRGAFIWEEASWNSELRRFVKDLINLRKDHPALRRGDFVTLEQAENPACYAFARTSSDESLLIVMNASDSEIGPTIKIDKLGWDEGRVVKDLLMPHSQYSVVNRSIEIKIPAWGGLWLG
jgi:cyclomaltodextrinase / maltogenic alpha-amylase / neopullulanase